MPDNILRAKDDQGDPHDLAEQLDDGTWGVRVRAELREAIALDSTSLTALETVSAKLHDENGQPFTTANPLPVDIGSNVTVNIDSVTVEFDSFLSTLNTLSTPLGANEVFTGTWEEVTNYAAIQCTIFTDAASATNGAMVQFSHNGSDVIRQVGTTIAANFQAYFALAPEARYFRIVYTNGPVAQTFIRTQVKFAFNPPAEVQQPIGATITDANIATVVRSALAGRIYSGPGAGSYAPVKVNTSGHLSSFVENMGNSINVPANSTIPTLTSDQVWTGTFTDVEHHGSFIFLYAIQPLSEAPQTVQLEWSNDNSTVVATSSLAKEEVKSGSLTYAVYLSINNGTYQGKYVRPKITNTATAQTQVPIGFFSVSKFPFPGSFGALNSTLSFFSRALLVRAVQAGIDPNDNFVNIPAGGTVTNDPVPSALGSAANYTSVWYKRAGYVSLTVLIKADQLSASDGFKIEHSIDGSTVAAVDKFTFGQPQVNAGFMFITIPPRAEYFRLNFTNGGTAQGEFVVDIHLDVTAVESPRQGVEGQISSGSNALMVRSILNAKNDVGTYENITRGDLGGLRVSINEHEAEVPIKALTTWDANQASVGSTPVQIASSSMVGRKTITFFAPTANTKIVAIGKTNGITVNSASIPLGPGGALTLELDDSYNTFWAVAESGTQRIAWAEIA